MAAPHNDRLRQVVLTIVPACKGQTPIAGAAAYTGSQHPMVVIDIRAGGKIEHDQGDMTSHSTMLGSLPETVGEVQLVACIGERNTVVLDVCSYTMGGTYTRHAYKRPVSIYNAQSGQLLDQKIFEGSTPSDCPTEKDVNDSGNYGGDVGWDDNRIWGYLQTWVNGTGQPGGSTDITPSP